VTETVEEAKEERHDSFVKRSELKVGKYDGKMCLDTFLITFDMCAQYNKWKDEDKLAHLLAALEGNAKQLVQQLQR